MNSTTAWMLANGYTDDSLDGGGALKGKNCTIENIEKDGLNNIVTFKWTLDDGTIKRSTLTVKDGENLEISELEGNALVLKDDGLYVAKGSVEISKEEGNIIKAKADGLYAKADEIKVDPDATNILENREDGLYVPDDYVKKEDGKSLVADEDIEQIETNKTAIEVLNGDAETTGSVDKKLADAIATLNKLEKKILDHIPTVEEAKDNVLYMVQSETAGTYNQYMLIDGTIANLGSTEVDLDGYAKTEDVVLLQQAIVDKDKVMAIGEDGKVAPIKLDIPTKVEELEDAEDYAKVEALDDYVTIQQSADDKGKALVVGDDGKLAPSEVEVESPSWSGTKAEFESLDKSTLKDGQQINITDDSDKSLIDDSKATADNVWSAEKVSANLGEIGNDIATISTSGACEENRCVKIGKCVFFTIYSVGSYSFNVGWNENVATFPNGFRPSKDIRYSAMIMREANKFGDFEITPNGTCRLYTTNATTEQALIVSGMFFTD